MSSLGGKIFFPDFSSFSRNIFRFINSFVTRSSFKMESQLSSMVSISSFRRVLCSCVSPATHFSLLNLGAAAWAWPVFLGRAVKKDARVPFCLGFFASELAPLGPVLRLSVDIVDIVGGRWVMLVGTRLHLGQLGEDILGRRRAKRGTKGREP